MTVFILLLGLTSASFFGMFSDALVANGHMASEMVDSIFFWIIFFSVISAVSNELRLSIHLLNVRQF
ncbi:MAG: hypothetical protein KZQ82_02950 [Candidatus Thiodiazotropha sp. (ex Lucinoma annulata)]|nr:hypothetical protein [Candidatus Thiodiazotropha sp. (ex Lucinoma borealis)]MCU7883135.1 hypothetical protein [Candidatus Thiodiazotropha sp. (ex Lucinoma annulata)]MCU7948239.1 hypothetical protein [Candidatus Thiodiazotropha sp. (ex Cardiolucina cf. quadrata)]